MTLEILFKSFFDYISTLDDDDTMSFMNFGYYVSGHDLKLDIQQEPYRYCIQLYQHVIQDIGLIDKDIVEIGCGRGGGGKFILSNYEIKSYIGMDLSPSAIDLCNRYNHDKCRCSN